MADSILLTSKYLCNSNTNMKNHWSVINQYQSTFVSVLLLFLVAPLKSSHFSASFFPLEVAVIFLVKNQAEFVPVKKTFIIKIVWFAFGVVVVNVGSENRIYAYSEHVFHHSWNQSLQNWRAEFETGVRVDFNEIGFEVIVYDEVESEKFKTAFFSVGVYSAVGGSDNLLSHLFHFVMEGANQKILFGKSWVKVSLELTIAEFIALLVLPIAISIFLDCVVGEVNHLIFEVLKVIEFRRGSDVPLVVPVEFMPSINGDADHEGSDIEFSAIVK